MNSAIYLLGFSPVLVERESEATSDQEYFDSDTLMLADLFEIERLNAGSVLAWFKRVDASDFVGDAGDRNLADVAWLTPRVMAHEEAVSQLCAQSTFYPAGFGTLFSSEAALLSYAHSAISRLNEFFRVTKGKQEWGIKIFGNYARAALARAEKVGIVQNGEPIKGANYLKLKQLQREMSKPNSNGFQQSLDSLYESIRNAFQTMRLRPIKTFAGSDPNEVLLSNVAVLEESGKADRVREWAACWNRDSESDGGIRVELSGPWPAYSFCLPLDSVAASSSSQPGILDRGAA